MTPEVEQAIAEIRTSFEGHRVDVEPEPQGGAYVTVHNISVSDRYAPSTTGRLASRIATLLDDPIASSNTELFSALDDFLGAMYALILARHGGFKERRGQTPEFEPPRVRARQLEKGEVRIDGAWMAGFHFNSALYRLAAVYHRVLKLAASSQCLQQKKQPMVGHLLGDVETRFANWTGRAWVHPHLSAVHNEVNLLKHEREGIYATRGVGFNEGVSAAEELLQLLEAWISVTFPAKQLSS